MFAVCGKVGLLPAFANTAVADVLYNADDLCFCFGVRCGAHSDVGPERIASVKISLYKGFVDNGHALSALAHRQRIVFVEVSSSNNPGPEGGEESRSDRIQMDVAIGGESPVTA